MHMFFLFIYFIYPSHYIKFYLIVIIFLMPLLILGENKNKYLGKIIFFLKGEN